MKRYARSPLIFLAHSFRESRNRLHLITKDPRKNKFTFWRERRVGDAETSHKLELTWLKDRTEAYDLGDNEFHLAFVVGDYDAVFAKHKQMGCVCYENPAL